MPELIVHQSTFERLQQHASPLVDTADMVVNRALDALENSKKVATNDVNSSDTRRMINPQKLPNLTHTKVLNAILGEEHIDNPNWNLLVGRILIRAMKNFPDFFELRKFCPVTMVQGCNVHNGFRHLEEIGVSFRGMAANEACRALVVIADKLRLNVEVTFMWRHKEGAEHPGERACLKLLST